MPGASQCFGSQIGVMVSFRSNLECHSARFSEAGCKRDARNLSNAHVNCADLEQAAAG